jgi:hypothetical protein
MFIEAPADDLPMSRISFSNREPDRDPEGQTLLSKTNAVPPADDASNQRSKRARAALWTVLGTVVFALIIHIFSSGAAKPKYVPSVFTVAAKHRQCPSWFNAMRSEFLPWKVRPCGDPNIVRRLQLIDRSTALACCIVELE